MNNDDPLAKAFEAAHIRGVADLFMMTDRDIELLEYVNDSGALTQVPFGYRSMIRVLKAYHSHWCHTNQTTFIDWESVTQDDIDDFRIDVYETSEPIIRFVKGAGSIKPDPGTPTTSQAFPWTPVPTKAENFKRGVKREKSHYKVFKHGMTGTVTFVPLLGRMI